MSSPKCGDSTRPSSASATAAEIEWFVGPHTIHGQGTFEFLRQHLDWPAARPE